MTRYFFSSFAVCIALLLQINLVAAEPYKSWNQLTPIQQKALQPLAVEWDMLPTKLQTNLMYAASRYPRLTVEQKLRFQSRLEKWSKLTPEQRERAREKYLAFSRVPPEKRLQVRQILREQEASNSGKSGVSYAIPAR